MNEARHRWERVVSRIGMSHVPHRNIKMSKLIENISSPTTIYLYAYIFLSQLCIIIYVYIY